MTATTRLSAWIARTAYAVLHAAGQLWRVNFTMPIRLGDRAVSVPVLAGAAIGANVASREAWLEPTLRQIFSRRPSGAFLDVGANLGQTLLKLRAIDSARPYYGFEPHPFCCHYLREVIARNGLRNSSIVPVALGDGVRLAPLLSTGATDSWATIVDGFRPANRHTCADLVPVFDGDSVLSQLGAGEVACIKIDAEGSELDVVTGLQQTIARDEPYIICEILPVHDAARATGAVRYARQERLLARLRELGYRLYRLAPGGAMPLDGIGVHDEVALSNYLLVPAREPEWMAEPTSASRAA